MAKEDARTDCIFLPMLSSRRMSDDLEGGDATSVTLRDDDPAPAPAAASPGPAAPEPPEGEAAAAREPDEPPVRGGGCGGGGEVEGREGDAVW